MMERTVKYLFSALFSACLSVSCILDDDSGADLHPGDSLPEFSVDMNDGTRVSTGSLKGKVSCVVFFHTECPDCRLAMPVIQRLYDRFALESPGFGGHTPDGGVAFALISRAEGEDSVARHWAEEGFTMPYSAQDDKSVYSLFASSGVPRVYLSDRDGIIRFVHADNPLPSYDLLVSEVNSLL